MSSKKFDCCSNEFDEYIYEEEEMEENSEMNEESLISLSENNENEPNEEKRHLIELKKKNSIIKRDVKEIFKILQQIDLNLEKNCSLESLNKIEVEEVLPTLKNIIDIDFNIAKECKCIV